MSPCRLHSLPGARDDDDGEEHEAEHAHDDDEQLLQRRPAGPPAGREGGGHTAAAAARLPLAHVDGHQVGLGVGHGRAARRRCRRGRHGRHGGSRLSLEGVVSISLADESSPQVME